MKAPRSGSARNVGSVYSFEVATYDSGHTGPSLCYSQISSSNNEFLKMVFRCWISHSSPTVDDQKLLQSDLRHGVVLVLPEALALVYDS